LKPLSSSRLWLGCWNLGSGTLLPNDTPLRGEEPRSDDLQQVGGGVGEQGWTPRWAAARPQAAAAVGRKSMRAPPG
jgi:hypothetical protein